MSKLKTALQISFQDAWTFDALCTQDPDTKAFTGQVTSQTEPSEVYASFKDRRGEDVCMSLEGVSKFLQSAKNFQIPALQQAQQAAADFGFHMGNPT